MSDNHNGGNIIPEITREEHDGTNNAKRVNVATGVMSTSDNQTNGSQKTQIVDSSGFDLELVKNADNYAAANHGIITYGVDDGNPQKYRQLKMDTDGRIDVHISNVDHDQMDFNVTDFNTGGGTDNVASFGIAVPSSSGAVVIPGDATNGLVMQGGIASGSADSGNPVKIGGKYNATIPTYADGQRGDFQIGTRGSLRTAIFQDGSTNTAAVIAVNADGVSESAASNKLAVAPRNTVFNGSTWDRMYGDSTNGVLVNLGTNNDVVAAGDVASGSADSGNPVKVGGKYNLTKPTFTDGQRGDLQISSRGTLITQLMAADTNTNIGARSDNTDGASVTSSVSNLAVSSRNTVFNGSTWDRMRGDTGGVYVKNAGTTKTPIHRNIELSTSSLATLYVATETWKATQFVLNSDATVRVSLKAGATYLTGNASIGITLNPGGGWVESGSPDSPIYIGLAVDSAIVVEKFDMTGTSAKVGGKIMFYDD